MAERKKESFVTGAAVLTASTIIIKILGAVFKIPLSNIIGKSAMGDFGVAYNIYALLLTLSTAGLPVALSRMVSVADALGRRNQLRRTFLVARAAFFVLGMTSTLFMLIFSRYLADFMGSPEAEAAISVLAPALVCVCLMSAYRGYTQGLGNMVPTSISQITGARLRSRRPSAPPGAGGWPRRRGRRCLRGPPGPPGAAASERR